MWMKLFDKYLIEQLELWLFLTEKKFAFMVYSGFSFVFGSVRPRLLTPVYVFDIVPYTLPVIILQLIVSRYIPNKLVIVIGNIAKLLNY